MPAIKLKPGETVVVAAVDPSLYPDQGLPGQQPRPDQGLPKPEQPVDPGYGIDLGLGYLRPSHPIVLPPPVEPPTQPVDPEYGIDEDLGYLRPSHPIVLPPPSPGDPAPNWELKTAWTPVTGWVVVAIPTGPIATPSKRK